MIVIVIASLLISGSFVGLMLEAELNDWRNDE
jgi:hypothetical protein